MAKFAPANFIRTTVEESRKIVWPNRETVMRHTIMVIISVGVGILVFAGVDLVFQKLVVVAIR